MKQNKLIDLAIVQEIELRQYPSNEPQFQSNGWRDLYPINIDSHTVYDEMELFETKSYYQPCMLPVHTLSASSKIYSILKSAFDNGQLRGLEDFHKSLNRFISFFVKPDYELRPGLTIDENLIFESILSLR